MSIAVTIVGATGWVGRALVAAVAAAPDLRLAGAVARRAAGQDAGLATGGEKLGVEIVANLAEALETPSDVVVDYSKPDVVKGHVLAAVQAGRATVIGTSGLTAADYEDIDRAAHKSGVGVIAAGNFSLTATLLRRFALSAAKYVADVEVLDYASAGKPDVPSGTAREIAEMLANVRQEATSVAIGDLHGPKETRGAAIARTQVHSIRLPGYVISCEVLFGAADERLSLRHDAGSGAQPYVAGTLLAIRGVRQAVGLRRGLDSVMD